jgi:methionyl-tRNA formyltransferase
VQRAVMNGDEVTGACVFELEEGLDTGPVHASFAEPVGPGDTAGDLLSRFAVRGAALLVEVLDAIEDGTAVAVPQPVEGVSLAPKISVEEARVDWAATAVVIDRRIRGCTPDPGAWTTFRGERVKVGPVVPGPEEVPAGRIVVERRRVLVGSAQGSVALGTVQPAGKKAMNATDWARGIRPEPEEEFS